ncbi:uncharacterized protein [Kogia breviceps]|uniref:uncharacterized protein n=1 Tax=Kogia breviceps TaxID=27615 RepID=UPI0034D32E98
MTLLKTGVQPEARKPCSSMTELTVGNLERLYVLWSSRGFGSGKSKTKRSIEGVWNRLSQDPQLLAFKKIFVKTFAEHKLKPTTTTKHLEACFSLSKRILPPCKLAGRSQHSKEMKKEQVNPSKKQTPGTSLVTQCLRICLPLQGTWVQALAREDPTCPRATKPACLKYGARMSQLLRPTLLEPLLHKRSRRNGKPTHHNKE